MSLGGMGQASQEMIKQLQDLQKGGLQDQKPQADKDSGAKFNQSLQNHSQVNEAQKLQSVQDASKVNPSANASQANAAGKVSEAIKAQQSQKVTGVQQSEKGMFKGVVKELMAGQTKMEGLMKVAMSGKQLSNQEMLGVQAGVYMFSQQMELTSKVIEKATSGIKQMLNTQV